MASSELFYGAPPDVEAKILFLAKFPLFSSLPIDIRFLQCYMNTGPVHKRKKNLTAWILMIADQFSHFHCNELFYSAGKHLRPSDKHPYRRYEFDGQGRACVERTEKLSLPTKWSRGIDLFVTGRQIVQANMNMHIEHCAWLPKPVLRMSFGQRKGIPLEVQIPWSSSR
jgi:hypothetical protein